MDYSQDDVILGYSERGTPTAGDELSLLKQLTWYLAIMSLNMANDRFHSSLSD